MLWFWTFIVPAILLAIFALRGERRRAEYVTASLAGLDEPPPSLSPAVTLIVLAAGPAESLVGTLRSLSAQDYPDYELVLAVPHAGDVPTGPLPSPLKVALCGHTERTEMAHAALRAARRYTEVFVFAQAGGLMSPFWARALVLPLSGEGVGAATGFRWYAPDPPAFWPLMRSVWNAVIAGRFGSAPSEFGWDGALAIRKEGFFAARLHERWSGLAVTEAMRESGRRIVFVPAGMVACPGGTTARRFLSDARQEMATARGLLPKVFWLALAAHILYCGAMAAAVVSSIQGNRGAEWALVALFGLGMLKGANRATLAKAEMPQLGAWFEKYGWVHTFWVPLASWIWLLVLISALFEANKFSHCDTMAQAEEPTHHAN